MFHEYYMKLKLLLKRLINMNKRTGHLAICNYMKWEVFSSFSFDKKIYFLNN